jgi:hypothetical protein
MLGKNLEGCLSVIQIRGFIHAVHRAKWTKATNMLRILLARDKEIMMIHSSIAVGELDRNLLLVSSGELLVFLRTFLLVTSNLQRMLINGCLIAESAFICSNNAVGCT